MKQEKYTCSAGNNWSAVRQKTETNEQLHQYFTVYSYIAELRSRQDINFSICKQWSRRDIQWCPTKDIGDYMLAYAGVKSQGSRQSINVCIINQTSPQTDLLIARQYKPIVNSVWDVRCVMWKHMVLSKHGSRVQEEKMRLSMAIKNRVISL